MKAAKRIAIFFLAYAGFVAVFESVTGYLQRESENTLIFTTTAADGVSIDRVLAHLESDGQLYVSAHHWPRAWYNRALEDPKVQVTLDGEKGNYVAVPVTGDEHDRVNDENRHHIMFRIVTGFPPRYFVRLDPR